jgi:aminopeptidase N
MENSTAIFYDQKLYRDKTLDEALIAHETAHQWFGDAVTAREWPHLWLSEGFATYLSALWTAHAEGDSAFQSRMNTAAATIFESAATERPVIDTVTTDLVELLNSNSYQKGSWVLHQLRGIVGDSAFFTGLRRYYAAYRDSTALSPDFARIMAETAGRNLDWYFRQALTQPGYAVLDLKWKHRGRQLTLDIEQTQKAQWGTYRIPSLELRIDGKLVRVDVEGRSTRTVVNDIGRRPKKIEVDPNGWWLLKEMVRGEK